MQFGKGQEPINEFQPDQINTQRLIGPTRPTILARFELIKFPQNNAFRFRGTASFYLVSSLNLRRLKSEAPIFQPKSDQVRPTLSLPDLTKSLLGPIKFRLTQPGNHQMQQWLQMTLSECNSFHHQKLATGRRIPS